MRTEKNRKTAIAIILLVLIAFVGVFGWRGQVAVRDAARNILTSRNMANGIIPADSVKWCTLPVSHDLDQGGVPDDIQDITHPSVLCIPEGMSSHRWWMAATPYPSSLKVHGEPYENTCIFWSDNAEDCAPTEFRPIGRNPIIYKSGGGYNSDPDIFFDEADSTLYAFTRKRHGADYVSNIVIQSSRDGEHWSEPTSIVKTETKSLCPCVVKCDGVYRMYLFEYAPGTVRNPTSSIEIWESASLSDPQFRHKRSVPWTLDSYFWHGDILRYGDRYYMIYCGANRNYGTLIGTADEAKYLWVAESDDGYVFRGYSRPLLKMNGVYRSTFVIVDGTIYCYFSVSNRFRGDREKYPYGNRIGLIRYPVDKLSELK